MSTAAPLSPDEHEQADRAKAQEQVEATVAAADRGLILLGQLRDALEELEPLVKGAFMAIGRVPKYDVELPADAVGKRHTFDELGLPETLVARLRPSRERHLETLAAIDVATVALARVKHSATEDGVVAEQQWAAADEALAHSALTCKVCTGHGDSSEGHSDLTCRVCNPAGA